MGSTSIHRFGIYGYGSVLSNSRPRGEDFTEPYATVTVRETYP